MNVDEREKGESASSAQCPDSISHFRLSKQDSICKIKGIGARYRCRFNACEIFTIGDLAKISTSSADFYLRSKILDTMEKKTNGKMTDRKLIQCIDLAKRSLVPQRIKV